MNNLLNGAKESVKSTHQAELIKIELKKHENSDFLSIIPVYGYEYIGRTSDWVGISHGVWFCPDILLDTTRPEFLFLYPDAKYTEDGSRGGTYARVKAKKLRGKISYGVMVPAAPEDLTLTGEALYEKYGARRYEPPLNTGGGKNSIAVGGEACSGPSCFHVKYDVDSLQRYNHLLKDGEPVFVTEKIHGCFWEDSLVLMGDGKTEKKIKDVQVGDLVMSYEQRTEVFSNKKVINKFVKPKVDEVKWIKLTFDNNQEVVCTEDHKFLTRDGWKEAKYLSENDRFVSVL